MIDYLMNAINSPEGQAVINVLKDPNLQAFGIIMGTMGAIAHYITKEPKETAPNNEIGVLRNRVNQLESRINLYQRKE